MSLISRKMSGSKASSIPALLAFALAFALISALTPSASVRAQVPVRINSGNPAFPFPQFLPYAHPNGDTLYNLGTHGPEGVTHAEMEQAIRDAYQIMMNRAEYATLNGIDRVGGANGTRYIAFKSVPRCSEGDGYAMLAAAMMADKETFDGLWLHVHDFSMNKVVRYGDGGQNSPNYDYSMLPGVYSGAGDNSAADGDYDIAFALMIAHMQWGDLMGINDSRGNPISYKDDLIKILKGLTDTLSFRQSNYGTLWSGSIGLDGFFKGGDTWSDLTGWARSMDNLRTIGINKPAEQPGPTGQYFDYNAPAYFRQFADYLKQLPNAAAYAWNISQFERAAASSDWLMGRLIEQNQRYIPLVGWVEYNAGGTPSFNNVMPAEDARAPWRTIINYMWHGNPVDSWNPATHQVLRNTPNTYQRDAGRRYARFLWDRRQSPWGASCETIIGDGLWWGPSMIKWSYDMDGSNPGTFPMNWLQGSGSPSAVVSQDFDLMAEMYRQAELEWDVETAGDRYLTSVPVYFHGFFRLLGMMVLSGNHHAPLSMKRQPNMKVYLDVDKTYAFENDTITYIIDYRNYGAEDARDVVITNRLHSDMFLVGSSSGGAYDPASNTIRWNIGTVPGFRTETGIAPTVGRCSLKVVIPFANLKRYENQVEITASNGPGAVSNEYPNRISSVMKRNGVDMARRALRVEHSVYRDTVNPGMAAVYTIDFENSAEAGWLNGGRPGVNFAYGHSGTAENASSHTFMIRAFNDAQEAYIDYGNYRVSYFMFDNNFRGLASAGNNSGWSAPMDIIEPGSLRDDTKLDHENITPGQDDRGRWNQRLIMQLADVRNPARTDTNWATMAAPTQFLINYFGMDSRVHRGSNSPLRAVWRMFGGNYANRNWGGDWSFNPRVVIDVADGGMANWGYPIGPDFTDDPDPDNPGKPVTVVHRKLCAPPPAAIVDNILIEEWDGYTWRRVYGNGPLPGREVVNVVIRDTIPNGVTFLNFVGPAPLGVEPTLTTAPDGRRVVSWEIDQLLVGQSGRIQYSVRADTPSVFTNVRITSRAWASADRESPTFSPAILVVTRDSLPPPPPEPTTMYKSANKNTYAPGDTIRYTIDYKQTHGYPVTSTSSSQWTSSGGVSPDGRTITFGGSNVNTQFTPSAGVNMTLTGTLHPVRYEEPIHITMRGGSSELSFKWEWEGIIVTYISSGSPVGDPFIVSLQQEDGAPAPALDYKIVLQGDSLLFWMGDTTEYHPFFVKTGVPTPAGAAGVSYVTPGYGGASLTGWAVRTDLAYGVSIRDTIPAGVTYIPGSAAGQLYTSPPVTLTAVEPNANGVIIWPVVSGDTPMGANDSLRVTWLAIVDSAVPNNRIVNTAYADLRGHPDDAIGAQVRSGFSLSGSTDPDPDPDPDPNDPLAVRADPRSCIFTGTLRVTLTSLPGASIYYTRNGMIPDPDRVSVFGPTFRYDGSPIEISDATTLRTVAYADGFDPSDVMTYTYEPLKTVPVSSAVFFDDVGDGLAHGVKLVLPQSRGEDVNQDVVKRHQNLITLQGLPVTIDSMRFSGDTITIRFRNAIEPTFDAKLDIRVPNLPDPQYANEHGYLAERNITIADGVAPVITQAIYYPSLSEDGLRGTVSGDTIAVTFNKYAVTATTVGSPFVFSYSNGTRTYDLELAYVRQEEGNTIFFSVMGISGSRDIPEAGDSVRIKTDGDHILNVFGYAQRNPLNNAVPLRINYPELKYDLKAGPSPFSERMGIWISAEPYLPAVFENLDPKVRIFDKLGNLVVVLPALPADGRRYEAVWDGRNSKGRLVASGTYLIHVTLTDQEGRVKVLRRKAYFRN